MDKGREVREQKKSTNFIPAMKLFRIFKNKFVIAGVFFLGWMLFFDHNNLFLHLQYRSELNELKQSKQYYKDQIEQTKKDIDLIKTNPLWMEKVAREQYLMKREGEDVFLVREK
jgi:cell division protein FtsB